MACTYTGSLEGDRELDAKQAGRQVTRLTRLLCTVLGQIEKESPLDVERFPKPVRDFWKQHKKTDQKKRKINKSKVRRRRKKSAQ